MVERKIIHIDMDAFFASVEQRDHPELRGKPIAVGGAGRRGVVASASYEARRFGVRSAMPGLTASRLCPNLVFVKARFDIYAEVSRQIRDIFLEYTDLVEPLSLDEAYLDVTENKMGIDSPVRIAEEIRQKIRERTGLSASAGVSFNKFLAKVASDVNKPDGLKVIEPAEAADFLDRLPIEKFHGIGRVTADKMRRMGIHDGAGLKRLPLLEMVKKFGKAGSHYYRMVRAQDNRQVNPHRIRKSIGAERTFSEDIRDTPTMKEKLEYLAGLVFEYMSAKDNFGRTVVLKIKTPDFRLITRGKTFAAELRRREDLSAAVFELLDQHRGEFEAARLLGVTVSNLERERDGVGIQLELPFE
jgi:DNA polymerase-4